MNESHGRLPDDGWTPATSNPGELYTVEGRIKAIGALARGLQNHDPRNRRYRNDMQRTGLTIVAIGIAVMVTIGVLTSLF